MNDIPRHILPVLTVCAMAVSCAVELKDGWTPDAEDGSPVTKISLQSIVAGSLPSIIDSMDAKNSISSLTIQGELNGTDLRYIREMSGVDRYGENITEGDLRVLDLSEARIVAGGEPYLVRKTGQGDSVTFHTSNDVVGRFMFGSCLLRLLILPDCIRSFEDNAFHDCSLYTLTIPSSLQSIGKKAFYGCSHLGGSLIFPEGMTEIPDSVCYNCYDLGNITVPSTVSGIGRGAFQGCHKSGFDFLGQPLDFISEASFRECWNLQHVALSDRVRTIPEKAFMYCSSLQWVDIPESVDTISASAFQGSGISGSLRIPAGVIYLGDSAFAFSDISELILDHDMVDQGSCFLGCDSLERVTVCEGVTSLTLSFYGCSSLSDVSLPSSLKVLGCHPVYNKEGTKIMNWSSDYVFRNCTALKEITIPEGIQRIGSYLFRGSGLEEISFPRSIEEIPQGICSDCASLKTVKLHDNIEAIGYESFSGCSALSDISIPASVTSIGKFAFENCLSLRSITVPLGVIRIKESTFYNCSALESVLFAQGSGLEALEGTAFAYCRSLKSISLPETVGSVGSYSFYNSGLESISLPSGLNTLDDGCFADCKNLSDVGLPSSLVTIGSKAFSGCTVLVSFIDMASSPQDINDSVFDGCFLQNAVLYVPQSSVEAYRSADVWNCFGTVSPL